MRSPKLFTPGPTAVPAEVLETQARPLIHHRTEEFRRALTESMRGLQYVLSTRNPVVVLTASGSGAMEAAVLNLTKPGDTVIVTEVGKFSERWREIAEAFGVRVVVVRAEYGQVASRRRRRASVQGEPGRRRALHHAFGDVHGRAARRRSDGEGRAAARGLDRGRCHHQRGCHDVRTDEWGLDAVVGGSQKGVMIPPGLGTCHSPSARSRACGRGATRSTTSIC